MNALVTRRSLLLAGAAAAAAGVAGAAVHLPRAAADMRILSAREVRIVEALAAVLFPPGIFPVHGGDGGTAPLVDEVLSSALPPAAVPPFRYVLRAIETGTLISRGRSFTDLAPDEARDVVSVWAGDDPMPRRLASDSVRFVLGTAFLRRPEVRRTIGFRAECLTPETPPPPDLPA